MGTEKFTYFHCQLSTTVPSPARWASTPIPLFELPDRGSAGVSTPAYTPLWATALCVRRVLKRKTQLCLGYGAVLKVAVCVH